MNISFVRSRLLYTYIVISCINLASLKSQTPWQIPISIVCEDWQADLYFGLHPDGSELFNVSLDTLAPPPGFTPYVYFYIESFPNYLLTDIRGEQDQVLWYLKSNNCTNKSITLIWDFGEYAGQFKENTTVLLNGSVNMLETDSLVLNGDLDVEIQYVQKTTIQIISDVNGSDHHGIFTFPNPSNHVMSMDIRMQVDGLADIKILDIRGCIVQNIYHGFLSSGSYKYLWNGLDFKGNIVYSGSYLVYANLSDRLYTKKIQVIK